MEGRTISHKEEEIEQICASRGDLTNSEGFEEAVRCLPPFQKKETTAEWTPLAVKHLDKRGRESVGTGIGIGTSRDGNRITSYESKPTSLSSPQYPPISQSLTFG